MLNKFRHSGIFWLWISVLVIIIDRASKILVVQHLEYYKPVKVMPMFNLMLAYNTGAAWSFLDSASGWQQVFLGSLAILVSIFIISWLISISIRERWLGIGLALILGGAIGNFIDRITYGHVIDFLSFYWGDWHFAIFNIADSAITVGATMICIYWLFASNKQKIMK